MALKTRGKYARRNGATPRIAHDAATRGRRRLAGSSVTSAAPWPRAKTWAFLGPTTAHAARTACPCSPALETIGGEKVKNVPPRVRRKSKVSPVVLRERFCSSGRGPVAPVPFTGLKSQPTGSTNSAPPPPSSGGVAPHPNWNEMNMRGWNVYDGAESACSPAEKRYHQSVPPESSGDWATPVP